MPEFFLDLDEIKRDKKSPVLGFIPPCDACGLYKGCNSPKIPPFGYRKKQIMIVGRDPGKEEDEQGIPFVGPSGKILREALLQSGIDMDEDCVRTNIIQCRPPDNKYMESKARFCFNRLEKQIIQIKPKLILCLGKQSIKQVLDPPFTFEMDRMRGRVIYSKKYNANIGCLYHPAYMLHMENKNLYNEMMVLFFQDINHIINYISWSKVEDKQLVIGKNCKIDIVRSPKEFSSVIDMFEDKCCQVAFDYETNAKEYWNTKAKMLSIAFASSTKQAYILPMACWMTTEREKINDIMTRFLSSNRIGKIVQDVNMEELWSRREFGVGITNLICDTILSSHVLDERPRTQGLGFQVFCYTGDGYKYKVDRLNLDRASLQRLAEYNGLDAMYTKMMYDYHNEQFTFSPDMKPGHLVLKESAQSLVSMKIRGFGIDNNELKNQTKKTEDRLEEIDESLQKSKLAKAFKKKFKRDPKFTSNKDLPLMIYSIGKAPVLRKTEKKNFITDKRMLEDLDKNRRTPIAVKEILDLLLEKRKLLKTSGTYLSNFKKLQDSNGIVHPTYALHTTRTYRSSSMNPNFQNITKRDEEQKRIRKIIIPSYGDFLLEMDFSKAEVCVLAMMSQDAALIKSVKENEDFHKYWASVLYEKKMDDVTEKERYSGKNGWVFPMFYGSTWDKRVWAFPKLSDEKLELTEKMFWAKYKGVKEWQEEQIRKYKLCGYISLPTGFRRRAPLDREQVINTPIQGTTFHLSLVAYPYIEREMIRLKMKSGMCGQVHDSLLFDVFYDEVEDVIEIGTREFTKKRFDWQGDVPMSVEWKIGLNWLEMEKI